MNDRERLIAARAWLTEFCELVESRDGLSRPEVFDCLRSARALREHITGETVKGAEDVLAVLAENAKARDLRFALVKVSDRRYCVMERLSEGKHSIWKEPRQVRHWGRPNVHRLAQWRTRTTPLAWEEVLQEYVRLCPESKIEA